MSLKRFCSIFWTEYWIKYFLVHTVHECLPNLPSVCRHFSGILSTFYRAKSFDLWNFSFFYVGLFLKDMAYTHTHTHNRTQKKNESQQKKTFPLNLKWNENWKMKLLIADTFFCYTVCLFIQLLFLLCGEGGGWSLGIYIFGATKMFFFCWLFT